MDGHFRVDEGYFAMLEGLKLVVKVDPAGWGYVIWSGSKEAARNLPLGPGCQHEDQPLVEAVAKALELLDRSEDDPEKVAASLDWKLIY
jgi:hypothetical protein